MSDTAKTKACPRCKTQIDVKASKCPNCHSDLRNWFIRHPIWTILIGLILIGIIGSAVSKSSSNTNQASINNTNTTNTTVANTNSTNNNATQETAKKYVEIYSLKGNGTRDGESFSTSGGKIKLVAQTSGSTVGSYSSVELKSESGEYLSGADLNISTNGTEQGNGETIVRNASAGKYFVSIISGVNWEVKVYEEK